MISNHSTDVHLQVYYRLISLWVLCEAFAGGMLHAIKVPGSGLIVGGCAVICICLIGHYCPRRGAILKATIIVAIFKMLLSPQSPATAYLAVFFQGFCGQLLFSFRGNYKFACITLAVLALVESAIQRIIVLTIIYGTAFWSAVNEFIKKLTGKTADNNYSLYIGIGYVFLHLVAGIFIGNFAGNIPSKLSKWKNEHPEYLVDLTAANNAETDFRTVKKRKRIHIWLAVIWILLGAFYAQSLIFPSKALMPSSLLLGILVRSILIILTWYLFLAPVVLYFIKKWLARKQDQNKQDITTVFSLLPSTRYIFAESWRRTAELKGFKRLRQWGKRVLVNVI